MKQKIRDNQLRTLWISRIDYEENSGVKEHLHENFYQFIYIIDGSGSMDIADQTYTIQPNHYYFIPIQTKHQFRFTQKSITIDFKFVIESKELEELIMESRIIHPGFSDCITKVKELFMLSCTCIRHPHPIIPYRIDVGFKSLLLQLIQDDSATKEISHDTETTVEYRSDTGMSIKEYLQRNLGKKITLEDIAQQYNFHPHYVIEIFRKHYGTTPMNYLKHLRLEKSKEYLEFTSIPITEIAELVGMTHPYFSRLFRHEVGVSPSEYRERERTVIGKDIIIEEDFLLENQPPLSYFN